MSGEEAYAKASEEMLVRWLGIRMLGLGLGLSGVLFVVKYCCILAWNKDVGFGFGAERSVVCREVLFFGL